MSEPTGTNPINSREITLSVLRYPASSRILHWVIAALVLLTWPLGFIIEFVKDEVSLDFYMVHESLGFLVLWLMLLRVGNTLLAHGPALEGTALERKAAMIVHRSLYVFLILMPVSGFLATNAHGFPFSWFGLLPVWSPIDKSPTIAPILSVIHSASAWIVFALLGLHIGAVVFHHVIKRDRTLYRIL